MNKNVFNPLLPLGNFLADPEPHVFEGRVYIYGSHDTANGETYCESPYEFFSADINDLTSWSSKGINYQASQDPLSKLTKRDYLYASDCCKGNDGRYYLYYALGGFKGVGGYHGPISVAVSDTPDGKFEYLGQLKNPDGTPFEGQFIHFDPGVINDDGIIRLYYGTHYPFNSLPKFLHPIMNKVKRSMFNKNKEFMKKYNYDVTGPATIEIDSDMLTVIKGPTRIIDVNDKNSPFNTYMDIKGKDGHYMKGHGFFEAASIRKINNLYYFIYSSMLNHELCYATSIYPDKDFKYGGVIISNGDVGYNNRLEKDRVNITGNIHGSIEKINDDYYVFYHRHSHYSDYSRFVCAEKIKILEDGSIPQVEVTTSGINSDDLIGKGKYPAGICCNLTNGKMPHNCNKNHSKKLATILYEDNTLIIKGLSKGYLARYKYFDLKNTKAIKLLIKGQGQLEISTSRTTIKTGLYNFDTYQSISFSVRGIKHDTLQIKCLKGKFDIKEIEFID